MMSTDHSQNNWLIVVFRGAKVAYVRGVKGDNDFTSCPK